MRIGEKVNRLTLVKRLDNKGSVDGLFLCDCGRAKEIAISNVRRENTKSCGCYRKEFDEHVKRGISIKPIEPSSEEIERAFSSLCQECTTPWVTFPLAIEWYKKRMEI